MNVYAFSVLVFAICSFLIGIQILVRRKDTTGVLYFFLSLLYCTWGVGFALCISGNLTYAQSLFSVRISNAAAAFIPIVWLHFCLVYTDRMNLKSRIYFLMYLIPIIVSLGTFSRNFIPSLQSAVGFKYCPVPGFLYNILVFILLLSL